MHSTSDASTVCSGDRDHVARPLELGQLRLSNKAIAARVISSVTAFAIVGAPVLRTGNTPRVRDGYISQSTRGHAWTLPTRREALICRTNVPENDRACTRLPPLNLHGKEEVNARQVIDAADRAVGELGTTPTTHVP
jgi:hypothetical protein